MHVRDHIVPAHRRGFSLLELSMVLIISGLMVSFVLQANQSTAPQNDCYVVTKAQMNAIRFSVENFARRNDRLPLPAARNIGVEDVKYGREAVVASADIDAAGGISYGALPFQALGLSPSFGSDCWGNKFSYAVTTALTNSTGFKDSTVLGSIAVKSSLTVTTNAKAAYAIISHGEDGIGAVKSNYSAANTAHAWCLSGTALKHLNCNLAGAVADATFNNGKDAGVGYFDDVVIASNKPQVLASGVSNAFCWGANAYGQVGDATTVVKPYATQTQPSGSGDPFTQIASSGNTTCGVTTLGTLYCWGSGAYGQMGNSTTNSSLSPVMVPLPVGVSSVSLAADDGTTASHVCALANTGDAYCWGNSGGGQLAIGSWASVVSSPQKVTLPGGLKVSQVQTGYATSCFLAVTGDIYCAGYSFGGGGTMYDQNPTPHLVTKPASVTRFNKISSTDSMGGCALADGGNLYCWGRNDYGELGYDSTLAGGASYDSAVLMSSTLAVAPPVGTSYWIDVAALSITTCGLANTGDAYCWGENSYGQIGNGTTNGSMSPKPVTMPSGVKFTAIEPAHGGGRNFCALGTDAVLYCWGQNDGNQIGDGTSTVRYVPTPVRLSTGSIGFASIGGGRCAVNPPPASWGTGASGWIGDGATSDRSTPVYVKIPDGVALTKVSGTGPSLKCGLDVGGKAYCWGDNTNYPKIGNGTSGGTFKTPTAVNMPGGITFKSISSSQVGTFAIGSDDLLYCWGLCDSGGVQHSSPAVYTVPMGTVASVSATLNSSVLAVLGKDGRVSLTDGSAGHWYAPYLVSMPTATAKAVVIAPSNICIIGSDNQVYCNCNNCGSVYDVTGDGSSPSPNSDFVAVTKPSDPPISDATFHYFTAISAGYNSSHSAICALADNNKIYCWGLGVAGMIGNGSGATVTVPTPVTMPTGVTGWRNVSVGNNYVTAMGNDGVAYFWGTDPITNAVASTSPIPLPLPPGASAYTSVDARGLIGLVR